MSIKARIEAIIYAAEEPVTFEQIFALVKEDARLEIAQEREKAAQQKTQDGGDDVITAEEIEASTSTEAPAEASADELSRTEAAVSPETQVEANTEADSAAVSESEPAEAAPEGAESAEAKDGEPSSIEAIPDGEPAEPAGPEPITDAEVKSALRAEIEKLIADYSSPERGIEVRQVAGGYRLATKPEQHDVVRAFAKSLKPPIRLSLQALETLAVIAYKQPITAPEISEVRGVDAGGVLGTLLDRKLITTAGRKQVIGRPILYKTTKEFLLRFGLKDVNELPSMEEFEKLAAESLGSELFAPTQTTLEQAATQAAAPSTTDSIPANAELPAEGNEESTPSTSEGDAVPTESAPEATPEVTTEEKPSAESTEDVAKDETEESKAAAQPE